MTPIQPITKSMQSINKLCSPSCCLFFSFLSPVCGMRTQRSHYDLMNDVIGCFPSMLRTQYATCPHHCNLLYSQGLHICGVLHTEETRNAGTICSTQSSHRTASPRTQTVTAIGGILLVKQHELYRAQCLRK
jgi:hypothetical protein